MKKKIFISLMISVVLLVCGGYFVYQNYQDKINAQEELEFHKFCFAESVNSIKLLENRCVRHGVSPNFADLTYRDSISEEDLETIKSAYNENEKTWYEMAKRYIRAIAEKESNIKSVDFEGNNVALISYAQLTEENGKRFDSLKTCKLYLYDAMMKIENDYFQYGRFILRIGHYKTTNIAILCTDDDPYKDLKPRNIFYKNSL